MFTTLLLGISLLNPQVAVSLPEPHPMALNPEIRTFLDRKVDRNAPPIIRLQQLVTAMFHDKDLSFTYASDTRTAVETFTNQNGNCLSFTILFIAMARYLDLDARFREVEIAPTWSRNGIFVNLNLHVNAVVYADSLPYAIDVFPAVNRIEIGTRVVSDERGLAHFYNNRGVDALGLGDARGSIDYLNLALKLDPTLVAVWINLGAAKTQAYLMPEAEKCYRKALELDSRNPAAMSNLANLYELMGRTKEANRLQAKVREFREKNPYHHFSLGVQAYEEGRLQEAIVHYRKALKLKPGEHNFYFAMFQAYRQLGQPDESLKSLEKAVKYATDPSNRARYSQKLDLLKGMQIPGGEIRGSLLPMSLPVPTLP